MFFTRFLVGDIDGVSVGNLFTRGAFLNFNKLRL